MEPVAAIRGKQLQGMERRKPTKVALALDTISRAAAALSRVLASMPQSALHELAKAPSGERILVAATMQPSILEDATATSPLLAAKLRGVEIKWKLLDSEGGTISAEEVGQLIGVTRQAVDKKRRASHLLAVKIGRKWRYPIWQFADHQVLVGMPRVLAALPTSNAWVKMAFLLSRNTRLGEKRPLDLLRQEHVDKVVWAARLYGEHGAA